MLLLPDRSVIVIGSPALMPSPVGTVSASAESWFPSGSAGIVIEVLDVVSTAPARTFQFAKVPEPIVPLRLTASPVSSSKIETDRTKSSRLLKAGMRTGYPYISASEFHVPGAEHERGHHIER